MLFVIDKTRLQRTIAIVRDDRKRSQKGSNGPFMRIEAREGQLNLTGRQVSATIPATVYEPGVLFLRITSLRLLLKMMNGEKMLTIQANNEGLFVDNVTFSLENSDMLLYVDPDRAPARHPDEVGQMETVSRETDDDGAGLPLWQAAKKPPKKRKDGNK